MVPTISSVAQYGTTSACAENTAHLPTPGVVDWNYLRVRGEYVTHAPFPPTVEELPPRARRIRMILEYYSNDLGTTSACAENTQTKHPQHALAWNYLRVRGEYPK